MNTKIINGVLQFYIDGNIYNEKILFKCFYWYGNHFNVDISKSLENEYIITIEAKEKTKYETEWSSIIDKIKQDLIDYKLRDLVSTETQTIRELIIAKAFAYYQESSIPSSQVSDPVGFNPENISLHE
jgi:His-Xaa-Ser system protein HxsD